MRVRRFTLILLILLVILLLSATVLQVIVKPDRDRGRPISPTPSAP